MNINNGVINYALLFLICILLFILNKLFKKFFKFNFNKKDNLSKLLSSFFSLVICVYFVFSVDTILNFYIQLINFNQPIILKLMMIFAFVFVYFILYLIIKRFILKTIKLIDLNNYLGKQNLINRIIVVITTFVKSILSIVYFSSIISLLFVNVYFIGITKPFVNTNLVNSQFNQLLIDLDKVNIASREIASFTDLFKKDALFDQIENLNDLVKTIDEKEDNFMDDVYDDLPKEKQNKISTLYKEKFNKDLDDNYIGVFSVLTEDNYYEDVFKLPNSFVSKIPIIGKLVYKNDPHLVYYTYIEQNQALIDFVNEERELFSDIEGNFQQIIVALSDESDDLKSIKDKNNLVVIEAVFASIDRYFSINDWIVEVIDDIDSNYFTREIEPYEIIDVEVNEFLKDKDHLDQVIEQFNKDYKDNQLNKKLFNQAYEFSKVYLHAYQETSLKIEQNIDPKLRLGAAYFKNEIDIDSYIYNGNIMQTLLIYLNGSDVEKTYEVMDLFIYGYLYDLEDQESRAKQLDELFKAIKEFGNSEAVIVELKEFNDRLIDGNENENYLEYHYQQGNIPYSIMKLLYIYEEFTSDNFHMEIKSLLK